MRHANGQTMENVCLSRIFAIRHRNANGKGRYGFTRCRKLTSARAQDALRQHAFRMI